MPQTDRRRASCNVSRVGSPHAISRIRTLEFEASAVSLAPPQTVVLMQATGQRGSRGAEGAVRAHVCAQGGGGCTQGTPLSSTAPPRQRETVSAILAPKLIKPPSGGTNRGTPTAEIQQRGLSSPKRPRETAHSENAIFLCQCHKVRPSTGVAASGLKSENRCSANSKDGMLRGTDSLIVSY